MSSRKALNRHPVIVAVAAFMLVAAAGYVIYRQAHPAMHIPDTLFYTCDDGQSFFRDSMNQIPPFMKEGKEAVVARVFLVKGEPKVGYMERYSPEAKAIIDKFRTSQKSSATTHPSGPPANLGQLIGAQQMGRQYKRPGEKAWVSVRNTDAVSDICKVYDRPGELAPAVDP